MPLGVIDYTRVVGKFIDHFNSIGRSIDWTFNGGEPLDMFDFPMILKQCKSSGGTIDLTTNGGKLWLDWWAIAPHVDCLHLSYHYWQNPNLIRFIIQAFQRANKHIDIMVPMRPDHFEQDLARAIAIESEFCTCVSKNVLYKEGEQSMGMFHYTDQQLRIMQGEELVEQQRMYETTTFTERSQARIDANPSFTGQLCNTGIESISISGDGWAAGSGCNNTHLGNIWTDGFQLPTTASVCKMLACVNESDQKITKWPLQKS